MKKITATIVATIAVFSLFGQSGSSNEKLIRYDTTTLKAEECSWMFKTQSGTNKTVPQAILESIQSGKLKAYDPQTNELIPGNKIFTWHQASDSIMVWDANKKENVIKVIQHRINPEQITRIRIYQDWYLNTATGKIESWIKTVDLIAEVRTPSSGDFIGYQIIYRVQY
jgi:hypothetical protein